VKAIPVVLFAAALACPAQVSDPREEARKLYEQGEAARSRYWQQKQYDKAVAVLEGLAANPLLRLEEDARLNVLYNLACGYSLVGRRDAAVATLREAAAGGYFGADHIRRDTDFDNIREEPGYQRLIAELEAREKRLKRFWDSPALRTPYREDLTEDEKIAGLSKFWSEAKYNFVFFFKLPDLDWDALYLEYLPRVRKTKSTFEYYRTLQEFCAKLRDGHTNVYLPRELAESIGRPGLRTALVEGKVLVIEVSDPDLAIEPGSEIVAIDGVPVKQYAQERVVPYLSSSTPQDLDVRAYSYDLLRGPRSAAVELTIADAAGRTMKRAASRQPREGDRPWTPFEFKMLEGNIGYIALRTFGNPKPAEEFDAAFDAISKTRALIFDIRDNGGGSSDVGWRILSYLTDKPFRVSSMRTRKYLPAERAWGKLEDWEDLGGSPTRAAHGSKLYSKPVVVLTSPRTFSAAEDFAVAFDAMGRGKIIGETTGGSTGQPLMFELPGGGAGRVCTKHDRYPDGKEFVGVGVRPDIAAAPTVADVRAGRDTVIEAALRELR
jgi:C-terminal processing protease CtpA/Prc